MLRDILLPFLVIVFLSACSNTHGNKSTDSEANIKEVAAIEDQWMQWLAKKDTAALSNILAEDFTLSGSSGARETREQYLATSAMPERTLELYSLATGCSKLMVLLLFQQGLRCTRGNGRAMHLICRCVTPMCL